jgi:tyrosinase
VSRVKVAEVAEFDAFAAGARRYAYREGEPRQRANLDCLSPAQLDDLRLAFRRIYDIDEHEEDRRNYNNQALIHQNHCQHGWERFLPWHRAYLYEFEQNLQDFVPDANAPVLGLHHAAVSAARSRPGMADPRGVEGLSDT